MRTFLAVFPPDPAREAAFRVIERLRRADDEVAWVRRENLHYTLRFMGELDEEGMGRVIAAAREGAAGQPAFEAALGAAGAYPSARHARALWLGLARGAEALAGLARALEAALGARGFAPAGRRFSPHLTLGRVRRGEQDWRARLEAVAAGAGPAAGPGFRVERIAVIQSTLAPGGSIYRVCAEAALAA